MVTARQRPDLSAPPPRRQPHDFDAGGVAARRCSGSPAALPACSTTWHKAQTGLSHAKAVRDGRRCHPGGDDGRRRRYRDGLSAQPYGVGQGLRARTPSTRPATRPRAAGPPGSDGQLGDRLSRLRLHPTVPGVCEPRASPRRPIRTREHPAAAPVAGTLAQVDARRARGRWARLRAAWRGEQR